MGFVETFAVGLAVGLTLVHLIGVVDRWQGGGVVESPMHASLLLAVVAGPVLVAGLWRATLRSLVTRRPLPGAVGPGLGTGFGILAGEYLMAPFGSRWGAELAANPVPAAVRAGLLLLGCVAFARWAIGSASAWLPNTGGRHLRRPMRMGQLIGAGVFGSVLGVWQFAALLTPGVSAQAVRYRRLPGPDPEDRPAVDRGRGRLHRARGPAPAVPTALLRPARPAGGRCRAADAPAAALGGAGPGAAHAGRRGGRGGGGRQRGDARPRRLVAGARKQRIQRGVRGDPAVDAAGVVGRAPRTGPDRPPRRLRVAHAVAAVYGSAVVLGVVSVWMQGALRCGPGCGGWWHTFLQTGDILVLLAGVSMGTAALLLALYAVVAVPLRRAGGITGWPTGAAGASRPAPVRHARAASVVAGALIALGLAFGTVGYVVRPAETAGPRNTTFDDPYFRAGPEPGPAGSVRAATVCARLGGLGVGELDLTVLAHLEFDLSRDVAAANSAALRSFGLGPCSTSTAGARAIRTRSWPRTR